MYLNNKQLLQGIFVPLVRQSFSTKCLSSSLVRGFCSSQSSDSSSKSTANKYADDYKLSEEEVSSILRKTKNPANIIHQEKFDPPEFTKDYEEEIEAKIGKVKLNAIKVYSNLMDEAQKLNEPVVTTIRPSDRPDVKYYKYDLPIPNIDPEIKGLDHIIMDEREKQTTPNQILWDNLQLDQKTDYESYELAIGNKYNNEMDMYGDEVDLEATRNEQITKLGEEVLPTKLISDVDYMSTVRRCFSLNINMPGAMENEDPNRFIRDLRPIEEFRNTPLIPISDRQMKEYQKRVERYHRGGFYFEVKKDTLFTYGLFLVAAGIGWQLLNFLMEKDEELGASYERIRLNRIQESL